MSSCKFSVGPRAAGRFYARDQGMKAEEQEARQEPGVEIVRHGGALGLETEPESRAPGACPPRSCEY